MMDRNILNLLGCCPQDALRHRQILRQLAQLLAPAPPLRTNRWTVQFLLSQSRCLDVCGGHLHCFNF